MKVFLLGPPRPGLSDYLRSVGDEVLYSKREIAAQSPGLKAMDFIVSYGYRYKISSVVLSQFRHKAINLHISLHPWNRGADPNLWSFLENTPKGVTIHCLDDGIDTGNILFQQEVIFSSETTLRATYERLSREIEDLFRQKWPLIRRGSVQKTPQTGPGTYHRSQDRAAYEHLLVKGWDTSVSEIIGKAIPSTPRSSP